MSGGQEAGSWLGLLSDSRGKLIRKINPLSPDVTTLHQRRRPLSHAARSSRTRVGAARRSNLPER